MKMKNLLVFLIIQAIGIKCFSQNLIANGSFDDTNICTEFNAPCSPAAWKTTSPYLLEYFDHYVGFTIFNTSKVAVRKYLQTKLLCPLIKDQLYKFSVRLKPGTVIIESFGVLFSDSALFYNNNALIKMKSSIDLTREYSKISKKERKDWIKIQMDYKANGTEKFFIFGNFQLDREQDRLFLTKPKTFTDYDYYVDDIELIQEGKIELCPDYESNRKFLYSLHDRHPLERETLFHERKLPVIELHPDMTFDTIRLGSVFFEFDSSEINSSGKQSIDSLFNNLKNVNIEFIKIYGYTDSIGDKNYNLDLSNKRAETIKQILHDHNLSMFITEVKGFGDSFPIASNSEESGRIKNRRVEVIIKYRK
jgi:outer membrane protein OmpA-like peptidoglycan-associated protein